MKNIPQAYRPSYLWFWPPLILGGFSNFCRYYTRSLILCVIISKYPFNGYSNLSVNFLCQLDVWRVYYAWVSKWAGTRYFYPLEIVYSTGRNYWTPPKLAVVKTTSTMVDRLVEYCRDAVVRFECENSAIDVIINFLWKIFHKPIDHRTCGFDHR
jgi:hypothetical protein